jgi:hypothetical protein
MQAINKLVSTNPKRKEKKKKKKKLPSFNKPLINILVLLELKKACTSYPLQSPRLHVSFLAIYISTTFDSLRGRGGEYG